jgi:hypothetical protein
MPITVITRYSGDPEAILQAAKVNAPLLLKHGATEARLLRIGTGGHFGQHVTVVTYNSYADYEAVGAKLMQDATYKNQMLALGKAAVAEDRTIYSEIPY